MSASDNTKLKEKKNGSFGGKKNTAVRQNKEELWKASYFFLNLPFRLMI
ncbi:hypothetical protein DI53_2844 [Sphingobacterium deserti]|uniref:Uncharacterized protein n=1 Tax=Sphingobacterium deserti TaxID=1229276 RepID=A0A0B8T2Z3_9SPHI|nr:hypothetical protein DI53_2844 [Sphingobacterium deserti]